jgi:hypothetical protein
MAKMTQRDAAQWKAACRINHANYMRAAEMADSRRLRLIELRAENKRLRDALDSTLGHSNCYCKGCRDTSLEFFRVDRRVAIVPDAHAPASMPDAHAPKIKAT